MSTSIKAQQPWPYIFVVIHRSVPEVTTTACTNVAVQEVEEEIAEDTAREMEQGCEDAEEEEVVEGAAMEEVEEASNAYSKTAAADLGASGDTATAAAAASVAGHAPGPRRKV